MYDFILGVAPFLRIQQAYESPNNAKYAISGDKFEPNPDYTYVEVWRGDTYMGCFSFCQTERPDTICVHTTLLPISYGSASKIGIELINWLAGQDTYKILRTLGDPENRPIIRLIRSVGFVNVGPSDQTMRISGQVHQFDIFELPITRRGAYAI